MRRTVAVLALLLLAAPPAGAEDREGCLQCHGLGGFGRPGEGGFRSLSVDGSGFDASGHGRLGCRSCHRDVVSLPHDVSSARVNCGMDCHVTDERTGKPYSHEALYWGFMASVHGKEAGTSIVCVTCHPRNPAPGDRQLTPAERTGVCGSCHPGGDGGKRGNHGYLGDAHGRAALAGVGGAPGCPDCHSQHAVLPADNRESSVSAARLPDTCARGAAGERSCHRKAATAGLAGMSPLPDGGRGWLLVAFTAGAAILLAARMLAGALRRP